MKTLLFFAFFALLPIALPGLTLKDKLLSAKAGDFVITEQNKIFSILLVRNISSTSIELEEISVPTSQINLKETQWRSWLDNLAPGHTSWMHYQINFVEEKLTENYSFSEKKWLFADDSNYLLANLLCLPLTLVPNSERRRLGSPPMDDEQDHRAIWNPPMTRGSTKIKHPNYAVFRGKWPKDNSQLSECSIIFYFDADNPSFPFPYWLELSNGHYTLKLHTIDSGSALTTPFTHVSPPPPFNFIGPAKATKKTLRFTLLTPLKEDNLKLFARDLTDPKKPLQPVTTIKKTGKKKSIVYLDVSTKTLSTILTKGHRYQWIIQSKTNPNLRVESNDRFTMKQ